MKSVLSSPLTWIVCGVVAHLFAEYKEVSIRDVMNSALICESKELFKMFFKFPAFGLYAVARFLTVLFFILFLVSLYSRVKMM